MTLGGAKKNRPVLIFLGLMVASLAALLLLPPIVTTVDRSVRQWIEGSHMILAYLLAAVVLIHVIGALRHHLLKRNDVLRRMTWGIRG